MAAVVAVLLFAGYAFIAGYALIVGASLGIMVALVAYPAFTLAVVLVVIAVSMVTGLARAVQRQPLWRGTDGEPAGERHRVAGHVRGRQANAIDCGPPVAR